MLLATFCAPRSSRAVHQVSKSAHGDSDQRLPRDRDREFLPRSSGLRELHLKHSVLRAKLLLPQPLHFQSPGRGSLPPPLPLSLPPSLPAPAMPRSSLSSPRAAFLRRSFSQSGVPLSELGLLALRSLSPMGNRNGNDWGREAKMA
eukprot:CAMPEP_0181453008 /NCGR_PEP_ID=MMETSP1110-20121109/29503_1 /TAXON_ID=174948 /ORGANISM="Symbiodinium sp., Strain CCMP421" /LENGTH=145 /DNA_ID=CAMNT_0023577313 /DNA_START=14 /DNA_END=447 /DNA_ORIENTATION=-